MISADVSPQWDTPTSAAHALNTLQYNTLRRITRFGTPTALPVARVDDVEVDSTDAEAATAEAPHPDDGFARPRKGKKTMKRRTMMLLVGASVLMAADAEAQRARGQGGNGRVERDGRVERLEPVRAPGRIAPRRVVRTQRYGPTSRVVYTTRTRYDNRGWHRVPVRDFRRVYFRGYRDRRAFLTQSELRHIIGKRGVDLVRDAGRDAGLRGSLRGHWVHERGRRSTLVVTMNRVDVAEFVDFDGDGYVDDLFLVGPARRGYVGRGW